MPIDKWIKRIDVLVSEAKNSGRDFLQYEEVAGKLGVSPNYARELLKIYAVLNNLTYDRKGGKLLLKGDQK